MKIVSLTLKEAHLLVTDLTKEVMSIQTKLAVHHGVNVFLSGQWGETALVEIQQKKNEEILNLLGKVALVVELKYAIRKLISDANQKSGINDMLADVAQLEEQVKVLTPFLNSNGFKQDDVSFYLRKLVNILEKGDTGRYGESEIALPTMSEKQIQEFTSSIKSYKRQILRMKDSIAALNASTTISVSIPDALAYLMD